MIQLDSIEDAMSDLEIANRLTPDQPEVLAVLGLCYLRQNEITNALAAFDQAIDLDPRIQIFISNAAILTVCKVTTALP
jgi:Flp pilus assembly protein TadD